MAKRDTAIILLLSLLALFAVKPRYGGQTTIRLNEPTSFSLNTSNYSNLILYSLIYENFFYLNTDGTVNSHLFEAYTYDAKNKIVALTLKENLSFSNGKPITAGNIRLSVQSYLNQDLFSATRLRKILKNIRINGNQILLELLQDHPDVVTMLAAPELVVVAENEQTFSGPFSPAEWEKNRHIILKANPYYPGGRTYLDEVKVVFDGSIVPDIFLAAPSQLKNEYQEFNSGIYQNIYLCFPQGEVGQNTRVALYTLLKKFKEASKPDFSELHSLTSDEESPVSIEIKPVREQKMISILKFADIKFYILSSLASLEPELDAYLGRVRVKLETVVIDDSQLKNFLSNNSVKYILIDKIFQKKMNAEEKIGQILKELSFSQFDEKYLRMLAELNEVKFLNNQELLVEQIARINETIINDGFILPLFHKSYSLYIRNNLRPVEVDSFGRPQLHKAQIQSE